MSCPSRLRTSPTKSIGGILSASFDPFAAVGDIEPPGCTPMASVQLRPGAPIAPRKAHANSPPPGVKLFGDQPASCPPERLGRRARPILRVRCVSRR